MHKILKIAVIAIGVLGVILWLMLLGSTDPYADFMFYISYILLFISVGFVLIYSVKNLLSSPEKLKKALIYIVGFAVVVVLGYAFSGNEPVKGASESATQMGKRRPYCILYPYCYCSRIYDLSGIKKMLTK